MASTFGCVRQVIRQDMYGVHSKEIGMDLGEFGRGLGILTRVGGHVQDKICLDRIGLRIKIRAGSNGFLDFLVASHQGSKREGSQNVKTAFHIHRF